MRPSVLFEMQPNKHKSYFTASLVIPTCNRKAELRALLCSAQKQTASLEIIVMDDGSTDGTAEMMRDEFSGVSYERFPGPNGPSFLRNRGAQRTDATILFFLDDDSVLTSPRTVEQTLAEFDHPRVAAIAIPYINVRYDGRVWQCAPTSADRWVTYAFVGAAHAIRRDIFLEIGGYREHFVYMGEESDFCLRLLEKGYVTCLGRADPIHHLESPRRDNALADRCGRRNDVLFAWQNVPWSTLPLHLAATTVNGILSGIRSRHFLRMLQGTLSGYAGFLSGRYNRKPVPKEIYHLHRRLKKRGPQKLREIEHQFSALQIAQSQAQRESNAKIGVAGRS
jgi:glycosyltransferase involved in cell wall biosynthesis